MWFVYELTVRNKLRHSYNLYVTLACSTHKTFTQDAVSILNTLTKLG